MGRALTTRWLCSDPSLKPSLEAREELAKSKVLVEDSLLLPFRNGGNLKLPSLHEEMVIQRDLLFRKKEIATAPGLPDVIYIYIYICVCVYIHTCIVYLVCYILCIIHVCCILFRYCILSIL